MIEKIVHVLQTTPASTDDALFLIAIRLIRDVFDPAIDDVKAGYEEKWMRGKSASTKDH